ncbi:unnamed protein product [Diabrotica balteata]|uniref:Uncharacterized protein n=1 Tax=Diabrotica balteata TaxID=107213 RepID=A0A9N9XDU5_DIABA|nr:unnamed protein product [Diabrotica balteata]
MLPVVNSFTIDETLEFQAGVLALIQKIKGRNRVAYQTYDFQNTGWQDQYRGYYTQNPVNKQPTAFIPSPSPTYQTSMHHSRQISYNLHHQLLNHLIILNGFHLHQQHPLYNHQTHRTWI